MNTALEKTCIPPILKLHFFFQSQPEYILGTVGKDGRLYFDLLGIGRMLKKKDIFNWALKKMSCRFEDIALQPDTLRRTHPMIRYFPLISLLKDHLKTPSMECRLLYQLLRGQIHLKYKGIILNEHVLKFCPCSRLKGIPFPNWIQCHTAKLLNSSV